MNDRVHDKGPITWHKRSHPCAAQQLSAARAPLEVLEMGKAALAEAPKGTKKHRALRGQEGDGGEGQSGGGRPMR